MSAADDRPRVLALEWLDPPFVGGHWVPEMISAAGGIDGIGPKGESSVEVSWVDIQQYDPEVIVLMPCGYHLDEVIESFRPKDFPAQWNGLSAVKEDRVYAVDASAYFNRPGPRIVDGIEILAEIIQPDLFPSGNPTGRWRHISPST